MKPDDAIRNLSAIRLAVGAGSWLAPRLTGKAFMLDIEANPQAPYLARLFGARDVALAYGTLTSGAEARRTWLAAGLACDVADALAAYAGGRQGYLSRLQTALVGGTAVAAAALGVLALTGDSGAAPAA